MAAHIHQPPPYLYTYWERNQVIFLRILKGGNKPSYLVGLGGHQKEVLQEQRPILPYKNHGRLGWDARRGPA